MRAIDTNVLVRLTVRDDVAQAQAAERFIEQGAWVPSLAFIETIWVLDSVYNRSIKELAGAIEMLLSHRSLVIENAEVFVAALALFRGNPRLGFSDCVMVESARKAGHGPVGTFDRLLSKVEGADLIRA